MTVPHGDVVVDASVGIKLALSEEYSEQVARLFAESLLKASGSILVPDLFFIECANVLWKVVRRGDYEQEKAEEDMAMLQTLRLKTASTRDLMQRALTIACQYGITAYDACYVALSDITGTPLLTADNRLAHILTDSPFKVMTLQSLEP